MKGNAIQKTLVIIAK